MHQGSGSASGTARYAARFADARDFYRSAQGLTVSSIGIGSYLGNLDGVTDAGYQEATMTAIHGGINFIDTSLNYRHQRSELSIGVALRDLFDAGEASREELIVCTKAGYLTPGAVPIGLLPASEVVGGMHCIAPVFLEDQLERSRKNLGLETIDVFYLHNPETQLRHLSADEFYLRIEMAFLKLEELAASGKIGFYGAATWDGYRNNGQGLSLVRMAGIAERVGGPQHKFRFIQLPFNLAMTEAYSQSAETVSGQRMSVLAAAGRLGISVIASASLLQAKLATGLPEQLAGAFEGPATDAARAIQFTRSVPGLSVALVGMSKAAHVRENLAATGYPPLNADAFGRLIGS